MRTILYVAPFPLQTTLRFGEALARLDDVRLVGVFQEAPPAGGPFDEVILVRDALSTEQIVAAARQATERWGPVHRLLGILENLQEQLAEARVHLGIAGMDPETARRFRDKAVMKDVLRAAGVPCARHARLTDPQAAWRFVDQVGFPVVLKPPAGAGCKATYRVRHPQGLHQALQETAPSPARPVLAEEFLTGAEHSYETLTLDGRVRFESITRYYPSPLEVTESPWIQWVVLAPRDISGPEFAEVRQVGARVIEALGLDTGITHMEWFRRPDGTVAVGEIAARPPGARIVDIMSWAHDRDLYLAWARLVVDGVFAGDLPGEGPLERRYAVGAAFLRGQGTGRVAAVEGLAEAQARMGHLVVDKQLPIVGRPRQDTYEGEGWVIVRHEDTEVVKRALMDLITTVKVRYTG